MTADEQVLQTHDLAVGYQGIPVLRTLDVTVARGEIVALLGRNGVGKTTFLHTIAGVIPAVSGTINYDGAPASGPLHKRVRKGIALVTESRAVTRRLTTLENLKLGKGDPEVAFAIFPELQRLAHRKAGLLSGGEQQMVALGRVLSYNPRLLLVDELSFGLAPVIVDRLLEVLQSAAQQRGTSVLLVEQQPAAALAVADRGYVLAQGKARFEDSARGLTARLPEIQAAYLTTFLEESSEDSIGVS